MASWVRFASAQTILSNTFFIVKRIVRVLSFRWSDRPSLAHHHRCMIIIYIMREAHFRHANCFGTIHQIHSVYTLLAPILVHLFSTDSSMNWLLRSVCGGMSFCNHFSFGRIKIYLHNNTVNTPGESDFIPTHHIYTNIAHIHRTKPYSRKVYVRTYLIAQQLIFQRNIYFWFWIELVRSIVARYAMSYNFAADKTTQTGCFLS